MVSVMRVLYCGPCTLILSVDLLIACLVRTCNFAVASKSGHLSFIL